MIINKYYIDIECAYTGKKSLDDDYSAFRDWTDWKFNIGGLLGILCLETDTNYMTKKELFCKQIEFPIMDEIFKNELLNIHNTNTNDMIITWNGRDFDIPIIIKNTTKNSEERLHILTNILSKDRDLMDSAIYRNLNIKGGLGEVCKRLEININSTGKDVPIEEFNKAFDYIVKNKNNKDTDSYKKAKNIVYERNEYDIRSLPLLEEKLGLLYEGKKEEDIFHKNWSHKNELPFINKMLTKARQQTEN